MNKKLLAISFANLLFILFLFLTNLQIVADTKQKCLLCNCDYCEYNGSGGWTHCVQGTVPPCLGAIIVVLNSNF